MYICILLNFYKLSTRKKLTIFNDPIYGFITIPGQLIFELIEHKYFQRLRRISQMGLSYLVYPGAHHTRFQHAIGCMFLMQKAVQVLRLKDVVISNEEEEALYIAILLHDIGHGPFSHALENSIVKNFSHEEISLLFMEHLNKKFNDRLTLAIEIFSGKHPRKFLFQLISGQLDMDRLDYLKRDSFYTGASEGNINSERLITMLTVVNDELVIEEKGIYSVEKFIVARRLMYWQVYLHKTSLVAEQLLLRILKRAKELTQNGKKLFATEALQYFLKQEVNKFDDNVLDVFSKLDDYDIVSALKSWANEDDIVLKSLSKMILNRDLLKIKIKKEPVNSEILEERKQHIAKDLNISEEEASYFVFSGTIVNQAYSMRKETINLISEEGNIIDVAKASDQLNIEALSNEVKKYYLCYPKSK